MRRARACGGLQGTPGLVGPGPDVMEFQAGTLLQIMRYPAPAWGIALLGLVWMVGLSMGPGHDPGANCSQHCRHSWRAKVRHSLPAVAQICAPARGGSRCRNLKRAAASTSTITVQTSANPSHSRKASCRGRTLHAKGVTFGFPRETDESRQFEITTRSRVCAGWSLSINRNV